MNEGPQHEHKFQVKADFLFHAASDDAPVSLVDRCGRNAAWEPGCLADPAEKRTLQDSQAHCPQRAAEAPGGGAGPAPGSNHGYGTGKSHAPIGGSPEESPESLNASPVQVLDLTVGRSDTVSRNGTAGEMDRKDQSSLPCFSAKTKEQVERPSSLFDVSRGQQQISNANCVPGEGEPLSPGSYCNSTGSEPSHDLGLLVGSGLGRDRQERDTIRGNAGPESPQGQLDCGVRAVRARKDEPDLVIEVGGKKIQAHKSVLAEKSDYFKARQSRDILKVKGVSYKTLSILIEYVYTSRMEVSKDNVVEVITGAKILQIPCAVQAAMDAVSDQITAENCYEILSIAKKQRLSDLKETVYRFMSDNFLQVLRDPAVYGRLTGSERDLILKTRMEGKKSLMVAEINDVFDRVGSRPPSRNNSRPQSPLSVASCDDLRMIHYYNEATDEWTSLTLMPEDVNTKGCGICTMYNYLFVAGGIRGSGDRGKVSDKVFCYNPVTDSWSEVRPLNQARSQLKLVSADGYLYAIGGECLFTVEKYDPRMDRWTSVAPLPKGAFAVAHEATTCNGEVYVSGGSLFYRLLKYDPKRDEWQECPYNNSRKRSADMVALKNFIYRFDVNREQGVNVFKYNAIVKMWRDCASLPQANPQPFRCAVIGGCVYCVNRSQTLRFMVAEDEAHFAPEQLKAPVEAKGVLFPFVLSLPERADRNA
ncbi:kelch repeat and BTB domain-containing protein 11 [Anguilla rostrata]|uniref:kelch repeat and BTB domain-containing protein 11 n=1 Tax=Anguilla rostrata TaxID=7938 RepID=UPI0030D18CCA